MEKRINFKCQTLFKLAIFAISNFAIIQEMASGFVFMLYITFYGSAIPCYPTAHCLTIISFMGLILKLPFSSLSSTEYAFRMKVQRILCKIFFSTVISNLK